MNADSRVQILCVKFKFVLKKSSKANCFSNRRRSELNTCQHRQNKAVFKANTGLQNNFVLVIIGQDVKKNVFLQLKSYAMSSLRYCLK